MADWKRHQKRVRDVAARAGSPNHMYSYCRVIGCGKPARAGTEDGLDERYCHTHAEHYQRHGSPFKRSYTAKELNPYRRAALGWIEANGDNPWVRNALLRVQGLFQKAGPFVEAFRLRGLSPEQRAKAALARLRKHGVDPRLILAACLAVEMIIQDDPQPVLTNEFRRVQMAKVIHRMASGSHRRWVREAPASPVQGQQRTIVQELHVYPRSRGRVLRHLGKALESAVELLVEHHLMDLRGDKRQLEVREGTESRAYSRKWRIHRLARGDQES